MTFEAESCDASFLAGGHGRSAFAKGVSGRAIPEAWFTVRVRGMSMSEAWNLVSCVMGLFRLQPAWAIWLGYALQLNGFETATTNPYG